MQSRVVEAIKRRAERRAAEAIERRAVERRAVQAFEQYPSDELSSAGPSLERGAERRADDALERHKPSDEPSITKVIAEF